MTYPEFQKLKKHLLGNQVMLKSAMRTLGINEPEEDVLLALLDEIDQCPVCGEWYDIFWTDECPDCEALFPKEDV